MADPRTVLFIPARYGSRRFPGKPLTPITGATGVAKPLIRRCWEAARAVTGIAGVYVLTDDARIADAAAGAGAEVLMTSPDCRNGTERCAEAVEMLPEPPEIVVNLQGDAPLTRPDHIEALIARLAGSADADVATLVLRATGRHLRQLRADRFAGRIGATTAVVGAGGTALYFSREILPHTAQDLPDGAETPVLHHIGVYGYRRGALARYRQLPPSPCELQEGLEQLRFVENGIPVACVELRADGRAFWELNTPEDVGRIEAILRREGLE